ncbi:hypothetical protein EV421DRAFT_1738846 [Armillaria borealis]|uniref:Uncharacterized protein n=1 Tax=Armillaria borealis TaxID=47425 RepID=A0AA39J835_9AGAR|nr:hypothetical protein EV421DRAFT_1742487 [Armillaria borealis]KAK0437901.1 hypothetical protein EV421DRAFT_1738846 [Armillaria borealis]
MSMLTLQFMMNVYEFWQNLGVELKIHDTSRSTYSLTHGRIVFSDESQVWELCHGRNKDRSIDEVTFTAAATLEHHTRKPIAGGIRDELRFLSETITITDVDHGIRRNADGTSSEGAGQLGEREPEKFQDDEAIESSIQYFRPHAAVEYLAKIHHPDRH